MLVADLQSPPNTLPILRPQAYGAKNDVKGAKSDAEAVLDESVLKKDLAAATAPAAEVESDLAKAMLAVDPPSASAVFWSKLARPTDPKTSPTGVTTNTPALKPVTEDAPALEPVTAGGAPLPSIKELPAETPAPAASGRPQLLARLCACAQGITEWTSPSKSRRSNERKEASAPIDCGNGFGALLGSDGNEGIVGGKATSKATRRSTPSATNSCSPPACAREAQPCQILFFQETLGNSEFLIVF